MARLAPFEWRVLRDLDKHGSVERGAATNAAMEVLMGSGYIMATESHRKLITPKGYAEIDRGEPTGTGSYGDMGVPGDNHFDPSKRGFQPK